MTENQKKNYNAMLRTLKSISKFETPEYLRRHSEKEYWLEYEESLEMAYENMQLLAKQCCKWIRDIK